MVAGGGGGGTLFEPTIAQRTAVLRIPSLLSSAEIAEVHAVAAACPEAGKDLDKFDGAWDTSYLHTNGYFREAAGSLLAKVVAAAVAAAREALLVLSPVGEEVTRRLQPISRLLAAAPPFVHWSVGTGGRGWLCAAWSTTPWRQAGRWPTRIITTSAQP